MKKFLLGPFFAGNELNIIDQQDIHGTEFIAKFIHLVA